MLQCKVFTRWFINGHQKNNGNDCPVCRVSMFNWPNSMSYFVWCSPPKVLYRSGCLYSGPKHLGPLVEVLKKKNFLAAEIVRIWILGFLAFCPSGKYSENAGKLGSRRPFSLEPCFFIDNLIVFCWLGQFIHTQIENLDNIKERKRNKLEKSVQPTSSLPSG